LRRTWDEAIDVNSIAVSFILYTLAVLALGLYTARFVKRSSADFFLAGRGLGGWLAGLSTTASAESGWVTLGLVGTAFSVGVGAFWIVPGTIAAFLFNWYVIADRLRRRSSAHDLVTLADVLAEGAPRVPALVIRWLSILIIVVMLSAYVAAQLTAASKTFESTFGWSYAGGLLFGAGMVAVYTTLGGFRAVAWTDVLQAVLMVSAVTVLPWVLIAEVGGWQVLWTRLDAMDASGGLTDPVGGHSGLALLGFFALWLGIPLGNMGQPHILVRFMAARDRAALRQGALISTGWMVVLFTGAVLLGIAARAYYGDLPDPEKALPTAAAELLPGWLAGMMIAAILGAVCSTADSQLLVCASSVSHDFWHRIKGTVQTERSLLLTHRLTVLAVSTVAVLIALSQSRLVFHFVLYAWAGLGAAFGPALILSLLWRRTTAWGVAAGMLAGFATAVLWVEIPSLKGLVYELGPAFAVALVTIVLVSLLSGRGGGATAMSEKVTSLRSNDPSR
jgi:sodium/proline symporter